VSGSGPSRTHARAEAAQISAIHQQHQVQLQQVVGDQEYSIERVEELKTLITYDPGNKTIYVK
jgi:anti-sigma28 factor (negative regulator of flagellin synthesis)